MKNMQKGFTLIELMIVVAIIGILAAVAIPQYQTYIAKSQVSRVMAEASSVRTAIEACILDGRTVLGTGAGQCDPGATGSTLLTGTSQVTGGIALPDNTGVPQVSSPLVSESTVIATFGNSAAAALKEAPAKTLTWTRRTDGSWVCSTTAEEKYRPAGCTLAAAPTGG